MPKFQLGRVVAFPTCFVAIADTFSGNQSTYWQSITPCLFRCGYTVHCLRPLIAHTYIVSPLIWLSFNAFSPRLDKMPSISDTKVASFLTSWFVGERMSPSYISRLYGNKWQVEPKMTHWPAGFMWQCQDKIKCARKGSGSYCLSKRISSAQQLGRQNVEIFRSFDI